MNKVFGFFLGLVIAYAGIYQANAIVIENQGGMPSGYLEAHATSMFLTFCFCWGVSIILLGFAAGRQNIVLGSLVSYLAILGIILTYIMGTLYPVMACGVIIALAWLVSASVGGSTKELAK